MVIGVMRFFDYGGNHLNVRKVVNMYFNGGQPYEPHLGSIYSELRRIASVEKRIGPHLHQPRKLR